MKHIVTIICCIMLLSTGAYAQNHHRDHKDSHHRTEKVHRDSHHHDSHHHDVHRSESHHRVNIHSNHHGHSHGYGYNGPDEIECLNEWQELWNGCHVRLIGDRVQIVNRRGDIVVSGDRVFLTSNGRYEVKNGGIWSVRDADGGFTTLSGNDICYWSEGFYGIKVGSFWRLYDEDGDFVGNVWGEHITIYQNNLIRAERNGRYYYYDYEGNERY